MLHCEHRASQYHVEQNCERDSWNGVPNDNRWYVTPCMGFEKKKSHSIRHANFTQQHV